MTLFSCVLPFQILKLTHLQVLDECLRAISGFKGMEDLWNEKIVDCPFTSDCVKIKTISSAPSYVSASSSIIIEEPEMHGSSNKLWCRTIDCHMSLILQHTSAMVGEDNNLFAQSFCDFSC